MTRSLLHLNVVVVVWGSTYTEDFLAWTLPTHLSEGNLGVFGRNSQSSCHYHIFTTTVDSKTIENNEMFSLLKKIAKPQFHFIDALLSDMEAGRILKYDVMTMCHQQIVAQSTHQKRGLLVSGPEMLLADGSIDNLLKIVQKGKRLVLTGAVRAVRKALLSDLQSGHPLRNDKSLSISSRDLVALSLKHVHPSSTSLYWNSPVYRKEACAYLYWPVGTVGLIQRGIHLHPLLSFPNSEDALTYREDGLGIDGTDYAMRVCPDVEQSYVVEDSDEVYYLTFDEAYPEVPIGGQARIIDVASWVVKYAHSHHRYFMNKTIVFHSGEASEIFDAVSQEADHIVRQILQMVQALESAPDAYRELTDMIDVQGRNLQQQNQRLVAELAAVYNVLGVELYKAGRGQDAEGLWKLATEVCPHRVDGYDNLALYAQQKGDLENAIRLAAIGVYLDPGNPDRWMNLSRLYESVRDYERAHDCRQQANTLVSACQT